MVEWDEAKSRETALRRGFDYGYASRVFVDRTLERDDDRREYGERRVRAIGQVDGIVLMVVYTWREGRRRIISARRANRREREEYFDGY